MVRISATNGMYRMQEETVNRKRNDSGSSRDLAAGHHVKLALTTQIIDLETDARANPHAAKKHFSTAKKGGLCRLKHTYKHTSFAQDNY